MVILRGLLQAQLTLSLLVIAEFVYLIIAASHFERLRSPVAFEGCIRHRGSLI